MITTTTNNGIAIGDILIRRDNSTVWVYEMGLEMADDKSRLRSQHVGTSITIMRHRGFETGTQAAGDYKYQEAKDFTPRKAGDKAYACYLVGHYMPQYLGRKVHLNGYQMELAGTATTEKPETKRRRFAGTKIKTPQELWDSIAADTDKFKYVSAADCSMLVRHVLKREFPGVKFSVRTSNGDCVNISWNDGPEAKAVDAVVKCFEGGRFDGMIDLAYSVTSWLTRDGKACVAENKGSQGSMGSDAGYMNDPPGPDAIEVHFGSKYVFTTRGRKLTTKSGTTITLVDYPENEGQIWEDMKGETR